MLPRLRRCWQSALLLFVTAAACPLFAQLSTQDHLADPGFWPTQSAPSRQDFAGSAACAQCHGKIAATQPSTPMAANMFPAGQSQALLAHQHLGFTVAQYRYLVESRPDHSLYTVTDGKETISMPLLWAFGTPRVGQSYLYRKPNDAHYYEARVTYFPSLKGLGFTPSRDLEHPASLTEAMERQVPQDEVQRCFACHSTASTIGGSFHESALLPGVQCESCHGPGAKHVAAMKALEAGKLDADMGGIFTPAHLSPTDQVEYCGACHGAWWDIKLTGVLGPSTTRSAPYRLVSSKCWGAKGDPRITCTACHDPHKQLETVAANYDHACLACHTNALGAAPTAALPGKACPVARKDCTSCHMPKVYVKEMHDNFTDHRIRIAKAGEPFPE